MVVRGHCPGTMLRGPTPTKGDFILALTDEMVQQALRRLKEEESIVQAELDDLGFTSDGKVDVHFDEGFADAAQTTSERARVLSLADGLKQRLDDVQAAIHRVEAGTYGKCERCGKDIAPERLEAVPAARLCIKCASKR